MDKIITRFTIILVTIYFIIAYILAQCGIDILSSVYVLLFELCVVSYTFCSGAFHCRYIRWTSLSILFADTISYTDYYFNYIPVNMYNMVPLFVVALGILTSITLAIRHFIQVIKIKKRRNESRQLIANETGGTITS